MPSLLSLMTEIAPSRPPSPGIEPKSPISPISKTKPEHLVPFHALIQDYRRAPILPRLHPLGYVPLNILSEMLAFNKYRMEYLDDEPVFQFFPVRTAKPQDVVLMNVKCVAFTEEVAKGGVKGMTKAMDELTWFMRGRGAIPLQRFDREDPLAVFADPRSGIFDPGFGVCPDRESMSTSGNLALRMLRPVMPRFNTLLVGVHVIVYEGEGENMRLWMQRRGKGVHMGGMLDSTAGGAIEAGETPLDGAVKEAGEECELSEDIVRRYAKCTGIMTFQDVEFGPEPILNHMFELKRPAPDHPDYEATLPKGDNEECGEFEILTIPQLLHALHAREVQPSATPHFIYFLIRHGVVSAEDEGDIEEILWRCRSPLPVPLPHRMDDVIEVPVLKGGRFSNQV